MKATLDELCSVIVDCEHKTAPIDPAGEHFAVGTPAMRGNVIDFEQARRISRETFISWTRRLEPKAGDLLFAREAPVGPIVQIPSTENVAPGQRTVLMRPDPSKADARFLYYLLSSPVQQDRLQALAAGSTVAHLNVADIRTLELQLPPLREQQAVAEVLGAFDDKIAANTKLAAAAEELSLTYLSQFQATVALGDIVDYHKNSTNPEMLEDSVVAQYSLPAFDTGQLPEESSPRNIKSSKFLVERPSVLISKLNPRFPRIWDVSEVPSIPALASTEFLVLEPTSCSTTVLWAVLSQPGFSAALESKVAGTSGSHQRVKPADLLATLVADPREISDAVQDMVTSIGLRAAQTRLENAQLASTRDALLPQLMSGKLRVEDAEPLIPATV